MSMSLFTKLDRAASNNPDKILEWIIQNVPCMNGPMPYKWTERVLTEAKKAGAFPEAIRKAMSMAREHGYQFSGLPATAEDIAKELKTRNEVARIRATTPGEVTRNVRYTLSYWEAQYKKAVLADDPIALEAALAAAIKLVWAIAESYGRTVKNRNNVNARVVSAQQWDRAVNESMERARSLQTHCRHLSREDLRRLREAPTPGAFNRITLEIAKRSTRPVRARRRSRRAKRR